MCLCVSVVYSNFFLLILLILEMMMMMMMMMMTVKISQVYVAMGKMHALKNFIFVVLSVPRHRFFSCFTF